MSLGHPHPLPDPQNLLPPRPVRQAVNTPHPCNPCDLWFDRAPGLLTTDNPDGPDPPPTPSISVESSAVPDSHPILRNPTAA